MIVLALSLNTCNKITKTAIDCDKSCPVDVFYSELVSQISSEVAAWMLIEFQKAQNFEASEEDGFTPPINGHLFSLLQ